MSKQSFTLPNLYLAYRKAKAEAFYENTHFHALDYTDFERNLDNNLRQLLEQLNTITHPWTAATELGSFSYLPKSIDCSSWDSPNDGHFRALDPTLDWEQRYLEHNSKSAEIKLRLVIKATVQFQIISALWIMTVGHKFDGVVDRSVSHGNRLRRGRSYSDGQDIVPGSINLATPGLFEPYFGAYKKWREDGLSLMKESLIKGKEILAVTMDLEQFYHRVSPKFLLRKSFLKTINVRLSRFESNFTKLFLLAMQNWYETTPDYSTRPHGALPVGLSASKVIANVLLTEFDQQVKSKLKPIYYGRYVDDIFLVVRKPKSAQNARAVISSMARRLAPTVQLIPSADGPPSLKVSLLYAEDSTLIFAGPKQKIFSLAPPHGLDLIEHIQEQIRLQSSEYRLLPSIPETAVGMAARALLATPHASLQVDALRKADVVSVRRLGLSLLLSDIETFSADLSPNSWQIVRQEFYGLVNRHVITPQGFFDFFGYVHRVFGLMLSCEDYDAAEGLISQLQRVITVLWKTTTAGDLKNRSKFTACVSQYALALRQSALQAVTVRRLRNPDKRFLQVLRKLRLLDANLVLPKSIADLKKIGKDVLLADWGRRPYKDYWYLDQKNDETGPEVPTEREILKVLRLGAIRRFREKTTTLCTPHWPALAFPTRPLHVEEIGLVAPDALENPHLFELAIKALRGAKVISKSKFGFEIFGYESVVNFHAPLPQPEKLRIAVTSVQTTEEQAWGAAKGVPDRAFRRYRDINNLLNQILKEKDRPHYIVMPELSIPLRWARRISKKLASNNISLIAGVEYYRDNALQLRNDCLVSLVTNWPGYRTHIARLQPKFQPAHDEKIQLANELSLKTGALFEPTGRDSTPTVYTHGNFCFSILICSDLTNISHRNGLRGHVDALFALEWNKDIKTFSPLVESTANDLHAFVIQVNNRKYGDSRIRSPAKDDYKRDIVQVKGGASDYYVIGEIDCVQLRKEQRGPSTKPNFKPIPIGFRMSERRNRDQISFYSAFERRQQQRRKSSS